jgi:hypothetical protein
MLVDTTVASVASAFESEDELAANMTPPKSMKITPMTAIIPNAAGLFDSTSAMNVL